MMDLDLTLRRLGGIRPIGGRSIQPMAESDIQHIERIADAPLPDTYRQMLKKYGGFSFLGESEDNPNVVFQSLRPLPPYISHDSREMINLFYGANIEEEDCWGLLTRVSIYAGCIPLTIIPIADAWDNQLCLGIKGSDLGRVYFWDLHAEEEMAPNSRSQDASSRNDLYLVAETFEDFLKGLEFFRCTDSLE